MEKDYCEKIFTNGSYKKMKKSELLDLLKDYISNKPLYINEIKNFLRDNEHDLFMKYGACFKHNPGVSLAFNIEYDPSIEMFDTTHIKVFETYKPEYKINKTNDLKKKIKRNLKEKNKKEVRKRYEEKMKERNENFAKIEQIKRKIHKQD